MSRAESCGECRFLHEHTAEDKFIERECRRYPPMGMTIHNLAPCLWPAVQRGHWCGEFQPRPLEPIDEGVTG